MFFSVSRHLAWLTFCFIASTFALAQQPPAGFDEMTAEQLRAKSAELLQQAQANPQGIASVTLDTYPEHFTMLTVRTRSGGAEQHDHAADIFFVLSGEGTEVTGGTIENAKSSKPGEIRGTHVVGGTEHRMQAGDIVHIAPGTPHQTLVAPGKTFTYYVIKIAQ
jgi:mannose-6-phosphate isomerase-like protein (cupin superfamily)